MKIHTYWRSVGKKYIKNTYIAVFGKIFEKKNSQVLEKKENKRKKDLWTFGKKFKNKSESLWKNFQKKKPL